MKRIHIIIGSCLLVIVVCLIVTSITKKNYESSNTKKTETANTSQANIKEAAQKEVLGYNDDMTWNEAYDMYIKIAKDNVKNHIKVPKNVDLTNLVISYKDKSYTISNGIIDFDALYKTFPDEGEYAPGKKLLEMNKIKGKNALRYTTSKKVNDDVYLKTIFQCEESEEDYSIAIVARSNMDLVESVAINHVNILSTEEDVVKAFGTPDNIQRVNISGKGIIVRYVWENIKGTECVTAEFHIGPSDQNRPIMKWMESLEVIISK